MNLFFQRLDHFFQRSKVRHACAALYLVSVAVFSFLPWLRFLLRGTEMDYRTWFDAGQLFLHGQILYPKNDAFPFLYPPTCALFLGVASLFGKAAMILILTLLNSVAWLLCIKFTGILITRNDLERVLPLVFANLVLLVFVWSGYHLGQPSLILLALILGAFIGLQRDREILAGTLIALASALKAFPVLALIYLIYRRYWSAAAALIIALAFFLIVLPMPFRGPQQTITDLRDWGNGMLRYQENGIAQRPARSYSWKNQSAFGLANRLLRKVSAEDEGKPAIYANVADLNFSAVNCAIGIFALLAGLSFVAALPARRIAPASAPEFSALLILILIFTPLAYGYLFSWLLLPIATLARRFLDGANSLLFLAVAIVLLIATAMSPRFAQIYGSLFFAALLLYLGLALQLRQISRKPGDSTDSA